MGDTIERLADMDGMSVKDAKNMPHPVSMARWSEIGLYEIDTELGVFKLTPSGHAAVRMWRKLRETALLRAAKAGRS